LFILEKERLPNTYTKQLILLLFTMKLLV